MFEMPNSHLITMHTGSFKSFSRTEKDKSAIVEVLMLVYSLFDRQLLMFLIQKKSLLLSTLYVNVAELYVMKHSICNK